jgi:thioredoxin reductase
MLSSEPVDVLIVGGGPAGLTSALTLARQAHSAIIFDSVSYRNIDAQHMHMIPTWDHKSPAQFREDATKEILNNYSTLQIEKTELTKASKLGDSLFEVADANHNKWQGKKLIVATGSAEIHPDIPGYADAWTKRIYVYGFQILSSVANCF